MGDHQRIADLTAQLQGAIVATQVGASAGSRSADKGAGFGGGQPPPLALMDTRLCKPPTCGGQEEKWEQWCFKFKAYNGLLG